MSTKKGQRVALSAYFFLSGFCFATWTSRIPTIKTFFDLNEAQLGNLLLLLPISSMVSLPISGWLVTRFESRKPLLFSFLFFSVALAIIGYAQTMFVLVIGICLFSLCMRILNIAMNTQSLTLQKKFDKKIIGSFHGLWSSGGLLGVGFSTLMIKYNIGIEKHLLAVGIFSFITSLIAYTRLLQNDKSTSGNKIIFGKPDKFILYLGLIVFFAAICEGGMFDWSGVYFRDIVKEELFTLGFLLFMTFMALSRFFSDILIDRIGMRNTYSISALFISIGIFTAIVFPYFWPALIGFSLVGLGVAAIFPITFALAGESKKYSPGIAISILATYGIMGMLAGPPLIGYIAQLFNLRISFLLFMISGLLLIPFSHLFFKHQKKSLRIDKFEETSS